MPETKDCPSCRRPCPPMAPVCEDCGWDFIADKLPRLADDRIRPPYPFFGSKRKVADDLWRLFGGVKKYVEPFLGSAAMLRHKPNGQGMICVVNDKSRYIANFWRAVQHAPEEVARLCDYPVNEADLHARHAWLEAQPFEEAVSGTPGGDDLLRRIRGLEEGLQGDPLWHDPKIAAWWCWGQCAWIGGGWCAGLSHRRGLSPNVLPRGITCRPETKGRNGILSQQLPLAGYRSGVFSRQLPGKHAQGVNGRPETKCAKGVLTGRVAPHSREGTQDRRRDLALWFERLRSCLRNVVVCCGDWARVVTPCVLGDKPSAVFLDPPYKAHGGGCYGRYHDETISARVRLWAVQNGENPHLRIALCEYEGVFDMPSDWSCYRWDHPKGMSKTAKNAGRERVWCSPGIKPLDRLERLVRVR